MVAPGAKPRTTPGGIVSLREWRDRLDKEGFMQLTDTDRISPYLCFERAEWARLRDGQPLPLDDAELRSLRSLNDAISMEEVADIYLPMVRLIQMYLEAQQQLYQVTNVFLGNPAQRVPYVIAIAGSVAVGKSTTARILQTLLARVPGEPKVDLVTTDGFLYPTAELEARSLMRRKGFPESYDRRKLLAFVADVKSGLPNLEVPLYSHLTYDRIPDQVQIVDRPDVLIIEGLNVLQRGGGRAGRPQVYLADFFDFSIYVDANEQHLRQWYIERFMRLRDTAFRDRASYFHRYANLSDEEAISTAQRIWSEINEPNLHANILPSRERARLILQKGAGHALQKVYLRKL
jgi:type I pantothenate kinase